jgi:hypothetical protein
MPGTRAAAAADMALRWLGSLLVVPLLACVTPAEEIDKTEAAGTDRTSLSVCPATAFPSGHSLQNDAFSEDNSYRAAERAFLARLDEGCKEEGIDRTTCGGDIEGDSVQGFRLACRMLCDMRGELEKEGSPFRGTSDAHKTALILYTEHAFEGLGGALWSAWAWDPTNTMAPPVEKRRPLEEARAALGKEETLAFVLRGALAATKPPAPLPNDEVFRGDFWGNEGEPERLADAEKRFNDGIPAEGKLYTVPGFWSTTLDRGTHFMRAPLVYRIKTRKDTAGRHIETISSRPEEREVLFPPCTTFRIVSRQSFDNAKRPDGTRPLVVGGEEVKFDKQMVVTLEEQ